MGDGVDCPLIGMLVVRSSALLVCLLKQNTEPHIVPEVSSVCECMYDGIRIVETCVNGGI